MYIKIYVLYISIKILFDLNCGLIWMYMYFNVFVIRSMRIVELVNFFILFWLSFFILKLVEEIIDVN